MQRIRLVQLVNLIKGGSAYTNPLTHVGDGTVSYKSNDTNVASYTSSGEVTPKGYGACTITATATPGAEYSTYNPTSANYIVCVGDVIFPNSGSYTVAQYSATSVTAQPIVICGLEPNSDVTITSNSTGLFGTAPKIYEGITTTTENKVNAYGMANVSFTVADNPSGNTGRSATITVTNGTKTMTINLSQEGNNP